MTAKTDERIRAAYTNERRETLREAATMLVDKAPWCLANELVQSMKPEGVLKAKLVCTSRHNEDDEETVAYFLGPNRVKNAEAVVALVNACAALAASQPNEGKCPSCDSAYRNTRLRVSFEPGKAWCQDVWHSTGDEPRRAALPQQGDGGEANASSAEMPTSPTSLRERLASRLQGRIELAKYIRDECYIGCNSTTVNIVIANMERRLGALLREPEEGAK